jgi:hypothetical protein
MKKSILIILGAFALTFNTTAQEGFEGYLLANKNDRVQLIEAYINPAMKGLIYSMNNGWYHTAKVHKTLGFDVSLSLNASLVPEEDEMFTLSGLTSINQATGSNITAATVAGSEDTRPLTTISFTEDGQTYSTTFNAPGGVKESLPLNAIPAPALQVSLGLPAKFEVSLRLVPKVGQKDEYSIEDAEDIAVQNGLAEFKLNSYTVQAIASLNFPILNLYGGIGYGAGNSTLKMLGDYTLSYGPLSRTITDPIDSAFDAGSFRTTIGTRISLPFLKIFGSYTLQEYNTANLGIAISLR